MRHWILSTDTSCGYSRGLPFGGYLGPTLFAYLLGGRDGFAVSGYTNASQSLAPYVASSASCVSTLAYSSPDTATTYTHWDCRPKPFGPSSPERRPFRSVVIRRSPWGTASWASRGDDGVVSTGKGEAESGNYLRPSGILLGHQQ